MTTAPKNTDVDIAERLGYEARRSGISRTQNPYASSPFNDSSLFEDIRALLLKTWWNGWDAADAIITREKLR
ncbi:MAG: hypothetical protein ABIS28_06250 [Caldimonas sp.]|jgi:hypothetical protein